MNQSYTIETERLLISPVQTDDFNDLHQGIFSDSELMEFGIHLGRALTYAEMTSVLTGICSSETDERHILPSVIRLKDTKELIGYGGLSSQTNWYDLYCTTQDRLDVELFYVFKKVHWGRGFATEMAKTVVNDALRQRGVDRVWTSISAKNKASQRVAEKAGLVFRQEINDGDDRIKIYDLTP